MMGEREIRLSSIQGMYLCLKDKRTKEQRIIDEQLLLWPLPASPCPLSWSMDGQPADQAIPMTSIARRSWFFAGKPVFLFKQMFISDVSKGSAIFLRKTSSG